MTGLRLRVWRSACRSIRAVDGIAAPCSCCRITSYNVCYTKLLRGSLGIAISEAVEGAASREDTNYALGSVLNHVLLHQTVIGLEAKKQFEKVGDYPDMVFAPCGGGSNFGGAAFPFFADKAVV